MRRVGLGFLGLLISAVAIVIVVRSVDLGRAFDAILRAQPVLLVATAPLIVVGIGLRSWRWQRLLPSRGRPVSVRRIVPVLLIGYLGNATLPARLGEPIRAYLLARREELSAAHVFGTAVLERIVDLAVLAIMALWAALSLHAPTWALQLTAIAAIGGGAVVLLLASVGLEPPLRLLRRALRSRSAGSEASVLGFVGRFAQGIGGSAQRGPIVQAALISLPIWLTDGAVCWLVAFSLGLSIAPSAALLVVGVGALGTSIPSAPGYVGTYELAVSAVAHALGVPADRALGLALLLHVTTLLPVALAGAISLLAVGGGNLFELARAARDEERAPV